MLRKPLICLFLALAFGAALVLGLIRLFELRFEVGDIYPPYSSLRADPLGTKALATALGELPHVEVQRNFKPLPKVHPDGPVTLVYAGVPQQAYWTEPELLAFNSLIGAGSRAVFTFTPIENTSSAAENKRVQSIERERKKRRTEGEKDYSKKKDSKDGKKTPPPDQAKAGDEENKRSAVDEKAGDKTKDADQTRDAKQDKKAKESTDEDEDEGDHVAYIGFDEVAKRWGFKFTTLPEKKGQVYNRHAALVEPGGHTESDISWHSALCFRDLKPQWKVLYMCGKMPVIVERPYGAGSIVLVADSYLVSNEALRSEWHPGLIARIFSGPSTIIFDEEHNDLRDDPGIASLARKYRLHGVIAGLVLLAIFFVWKNVVRFVPAYEPKANEGNVVAGKESGEGFINLLRRSIQPSAIFETCIAEYRKAFAHKPRELAKIEEIWAQEQARPSRHRDSVAAYRAVTEALARKV